MGLKDLPKFTYRAFGVDVPLVFVKDEQGDPVPYTEYGEPWCYLTCNLGFWGYVPEIGCVFFDHNAGKLIDAMVDAGLIELTGRTVRSGYVNVREGRFNRDWLAGLPTFEEYCEMWEEDE